MFVFLGKMFINIVSTPTPCHNTIFEVFLVLLQYSGEFSIETAKQWLIYMNFLHYITTIREVLCFGCLSFSWLHFWWVKSFANVYGFFGNNCQRYLSMWNDWNFKQFLNWKLLSFKPKSTDLCPISRVASTSSVPHVFI